MDIGYEQERKWISVMNKNINEYLL